MRLPSGNEDVPIESPALRQGDEKKRKRAQSSLGSEKKRIKRSLVRKSKGSTNARALSSDSLYRLGDESEEEENFELVAHVRSGVVIRGASELVRDETKLPRLGEVDDGALDEASGPEEGGHFASR